MKATIHNLHTPIGVGWLDHLHQSQNDLRAIGMGLLDLRQRLANVGFDKLAQEVRAIHTALDEAQMELEQGVSEVVVKQLHQGFENSNDLLLGTLAGVSLTTKDPEERKVLVRLAEAIPRAE